MLRHTYLIINNSKLTPCVVRTRLALLVLDGDVLILDGAVVPVPRALAFTQLSTKILL